MSYFLKPPAALSWSAMAVEIAAQIAGHLGSSVVALDLGGNVMTTMALLRKKAVVVGC